ncbi:MAG: hypothetical protein ACX933_18225, partial [Marinobacter adhaerens]
AKAQPDDPEAPVYRYLLVAKDHFTQFVYMRPIRRKTAKEVAFELSHLFSVIGYPLVFQTDNGGEFQRETVDAIKALNPFCATVRGKPRTPRHQGSVERANRDIKQVIGVLVREKRSALPPGADPTVVSWATEYQLAIQNLNTNRSKGVGQTEPYRHVFIQQFLPEILDGLARDGSPLPSFPAGILAKSTHMSIEYRRKLVAMEQWYDGETPMPDQVVSEGLDEANGAQNVPPLSFARGPRRNLASQFNAVAEEQGNEPLAAPAAQNDHDGNQNPPAVDAPPAMDNDDDGNKKPPAVDSPPANDDHGNKKPPAVDSPPAMDTDDAGGQKPPAVASPPAMDTDDAGDQKPSAVESPPAMDNDNDGNQKPPAVDYHDGNGNQKPAAGQSVSYPPDIDMSLVDEDTVPSTDRRGAASFESSCKLRPGGCAAGIRCKLKHIR